MRGRYNQFREEERPFNMAAALLKRCDLLLLKANETSVTGEVDIWMRVLQALKRTVSFKLSDEELEEIDKSLNDILTSISTDRNSLLFQIMESLDKLETHILNLMYKYGIYYPKYEKKKWEDEALEEDI